jgi:hypothetical protein
MAVKINRRPFILDQHLVAKPLLENFRSPGILVLAGDIPAEIDMNKIIFMQAVIISLLDG